MGLLGRLARLPWRFWVVQVLCVGYLVALTAGVPLVQALPLLSGALAFAIYGVPDHLVPWRLRRYALAVPVLVAAVVFAVTGGDMAAGVKALTIALGAVASVILGWGVRARVDFSVQRHNGTRA